METIKQNFLSFILIGLDLTLTFHNLVLLIHLI